MALGPHIVFKHVFHFTTLWQMLCQKNTGHHPMVLEREIYRNFDYTNINGYYQPMDNPNFYSNMMWNLDFK